MHYNRVAGGGPVCKHMCRECLFILLLVTICVLENMRWILPTPEISEKMTLFDNDPDDDFYASFWAIILLISWLSMAICISNERSWPVETNGTTHIYFRYNNKKNKLENLNVMTVFYNKYLFWLIKIPLKWLLWKWFLSCGVRHCSILGINN